jgi:paraquat-inducible protein A
VNVRSTASRGLQRCNVCDLVSQPPQGAEGSSCPRCRYPLFLRKPKSLQRTLAPLIAASVLYLPANLLPILHTQTATFEADSTIMSGVVSLWSSGSWPLALLVFFASIFVPLLKLIALSGLVLSVYLGCKWRARERSILFRLVEFVGRWSMLDIFVVALLTALVQIRGLATITPGPAALAFAAVVILTMYAAQAFDPRLIWDEADGAGVEGSDRSPAS